MSLQDDPVLQKFRRELEKTYGDQLDKVVLFGSRARGNYHPESDYDIAVFLKTMDNRWTEFDRLSDIEIDIVENMGAVVHALPYLASAYMADNTLMRVIRSEGRAL